MTWAKGSDHVRHIRDLETMLTSSPRREYSMGSEPAGFLDYWDRYFREVFAVGCLMYLETVFGTDSHWKKSTKIGAYPNLLRRLEGLRCVRNCIVHNAGKINKGKPDCERIIRDLDRDLRAAQIPEELLRNKGKPAEPFYTIEPDDSLTILSTHHIRVIVIEYLIVEGEIVPTP